MIKTLFKKKPVKVAIPKEIWEKKFSYIRKQWDNTPANIHTYMYSNIHELKAAFPTTTQNKNDLFIGVTPWPANDGDIVTITKGELYLEYPLSNQYFVDLDNNFLEKIGLIPSKINICTSCNGFATFINVDGLCVDCK